jgi:hypothetical protein
LCGEYKDIDLVAETRWPDDGGGGRYTKKPYILEKMGLAIEEELEK